MKNTKTSQYPRGNAYHAWQSLQTKYNEKNILTLLSLNKEFMKSRLKDAREDPDEWIAELESIRERLDGMNQKMTDAQFIMHVLNNVPKEYDIEVSMMEKRLMDEKNPLTVTDLKQDVRMRFKKLQKEVDDEC